MRRIRHLGKGTQVVKVDLKQAYRQVPVHSQDQHLLAISWERRVYVDRAMPFGLRSAPKIFTAVADMIDFIEEVHVFRTKSNTSMIFFSSAPWPLR